MKLICWLFTFLITAQLIWHAVYFSQKKLYANSTLIVLDGTQTKIFIILLYHVMFRFKRVQIQMDTKYDSVRKTLVAVKKIIILEQSYITSSFVIPFLSLFSKLAIPAQDDDSQQENVSKFAYFVQILMLLCEIVTLLINIYLFGYFTRMRRYFLELFGRAEMISPFGSNFTCLNNIVPVVIIVQFIVGAYRNTLNTLKVFGVNLWAYKSVYRAYVVGMSLNMLIPITIAFCVMQIIIKLSD